MPAIIINLLIAVSVKLLEKWIPGWIEKKWPKTKEHKDRAIERLKRKKR